MASGAGDVFISRRRVSTLQALMPRGGDDAAGLAPVRVGKLC